MSLTELRGGLVATLEATIEAPTVVEKSPPDNIYDRAVIVMGFRQEPATSADWKVTTTVVAAVRRSPEHIDVLDRLVDPSEPTSIQAALAADHTLSGTCSSAAVLGVGDYEVSELGGVGYLTAAVTVEVLF